MNLFSLQLFPVFQNREEYYEIITSTENSYEKIINLYSLMFLFSFIYGLAMGSYHSFEQALSAGVKIPILFTLALLICFPALFIIQLVVGSKLKFNQMISIILSGFVLATSIMISFIPIIILFELTGGNYYFLQLLHIGILLLAGIFGMKTIIDALKFTCEKKGIYPRIGVEVFKFWVIILGLVGIQLAWNFQPFTGKREEPFRLFRQYEGNFYTAVIYSINQLLSSPTEKSKKQNFEEPDSVFIR